MQKRGLQIWKKLGGGWGKWMVWEKTRSILHPERWKTCDMDAKYRQMRKKSGKKIEVVQAWSGMIVYHTRHWFNQWIVFCSRYIRMHSTYTNTQHTHTHNRASHKSLVECNSWCFAFKTPIWNFRRWFKCHVLRSHSPPHLVEKQLFVCSLFQYFKMFNETRC